MTVQIPPFMAELPRDKHGRPIPWFVHVDEHGVPDHRVVKAGATPQALAGQLCWLCGRRMTGGYGSFVIGPMCAVNRVSAEPPSHLPCATYAARVCPFLSQPNMRRRETGLPEVKTMPAGHMIARNPGVTAVWSSRTWEAFRVPSGQGMEPGILLDIGDPVAVAWWAEGRRARRDEILTSVESGLPTLLEAARAEGDEAVEQLRVATVQLDRLLPAA